MSSLASKIASTPTPDALATKRGPANACFPLYGAGDLEDWHALELRRLGTDETKGLEWRDIQTYIDGIVGIKKPLPLERFKYHWRRKCYCWPEDLRR